MIAYSTALTLRDSRSWLWSAVFVAGNLLLPQLCHLVPLGGKMFLPLMLFTVVATVRFGLWCGLLTAVISPMASVMIFGAPQGDILTAVLVKSITIALAFGIWKQRYGGFSPWSLLMLAVLCQAICFVIEGGFLFGFAQSWADLKISWPGVLLQWAASWIVVKFWK